MLFDAVPHWLSDALGNGGILVSVVKLPCSLSDAPRANSETLGTNASQSLAYPHGAGTISEFPSRGLDSQVNVRAQEFTAYKYREPN